MKKAKRRSQPATHAKGRASAKTGVKAKRRSTILSGSRVSSAIASGSFDPLAEAIAALAAIVAELREVTNDLRESIRSGQEPDIDAVVVAEVERSEARQGEGEGQEGFREGFRDDFEEDS